MANNNNENDNAPVPTFVHSFRTLVHYQKNVLKTLVTNKIEQSQNTENELAPEEVLSISDTEDADDFKSNDSLFQYFIQKIQNQMTQGCKITILCTHITHNDNNKTGIRFPFIQYLLEKKAFNHQQFELPSVILDAVDIKEANACEEIVTAYISQLYRSVFPGATELTVDNCYVGACHLGENKDIYAMLDVSRIWPDIHYAGMSSKNQASFVLPSEIINTRRVYGFAVEDKTTQLFAECPELTKLNRFSQNQNQLNETTFPVPDVGYTFAPDILSARLACMVGPPKTFTDGNSNDASFHFQDDLQFGNKKSVNNKALTRYAVYYPENKPVFDYDLFVPMTYHILNGKKDEIL